MARNLLMFLLSPAEDSYVEFALNRLTVRALRDRHQCSAWQAWYNSAGQGSPLYRDDEYGVVPVDNGEVLLECKS